MIEDLADLLDDAPDLLDGTTTKRKRKRQRVAQWVGCPLPWLEFVAARVTNKRQLILALVLYRRCCQCKNATVTAPTGELARFRIDRADKSRLLRALRQSGVVKMRQQPKGRSSKVTLVGWHGESPRVK